MRIIFLMRMMTVLIVQPSPASPSATDTDPPHPLHPPQAAAQTVQTSSPRQPRDTVHLPHIYSAHHHVYDSFTKRDGLHEEDDGQMGLPGSSKRDRNLQFTLGLTGERGPVEVRAAQTRADRALPSGGPFSVECCPSVVHKIHPRGGISPEGRLLELYRDHRIVQSFYQTTCLRQVRDRPCPLVKPELQRYSRCVQKHNFVYAFVRDFNVSESFRLDYIRVKSGCSCEVQLQPEDYSRSG